MHMILIIHYLYAILLKLTIRIPICYNDFSDRKEQLWFKKLTY